MLLQDQNTVETGGIGTNIKSMSIIVIETKGVSTLTNQSSEMSHSFMMDWIISYSLQLFKTIKLSIVTRSMRISAGDCDWNADSFECFYWLLCPMKSSIAFSWKNRPRIPYRAFIWLISFEANDNCLHFAAFSVPSSPVRRVLKLHTIPFRIIRLHRIWMISGKCHCWRWCENKTGRSGSEVHFHRIFNNEQPNHQKSHLLEYSVARFSPRVHLHKWYRMKFAGIRL
jgi:hypothetical protein